MYFKSNQSLRARDLNKMVDRSRRQALQTPSANTYNNGNGIVTRNPRRSITRSSSRDSGGSPSPMVICKITGGNATAGFAVTLYANGLSYPSTGTGKLYITELAANTTLTTGSYILGAPVDVITTGGSD